MTTIGEKMGVMDSVKKAMAGRSGLVEKVVDSAVDRLGRYSESARSRGEDLKSHARRLDSTRTDPAEAVADVRDEEPPAPQPLRGSLAPGAVTPETPRL